MKKIITTLFLVGLTFCLFSQISKVDIPDIATIELSNNGGTSAAINAGSPYPLTWYDAFTGGNILATGPSYTTPGLYNCEVYYPSVTAFNGSTGERTRNPVCVGPTSAQDVGVSKIISPSGSAISGTDLQVTVRIKNFGTDPAFSIPVGYRVIGYPPVIETWNGNLSPSDSTLYIFTTTYPSPAGSYCLQSFTDLPQDTNQLNDTAIVCPTGITTFTVPYQDSFDSTISYWYTNGGQWEHGIPTSSLINYPSSPPYCWKTNLDGPYIHTGQADYLYSPFFDFSQNGYDSLVFDHWADIFQNEGGNIQFLNNSGAWSNLGWMGDPNGVNWYNNNVFGWTGNGGVTGWHQSKYDLSVINNFASPTQFRFRFQVIYDNTVFDGWAIDNFRLTSPIYFMDAGITQIIEPSGPITYGSDLIITVKIKNFGHDTLYSIPVKYMINGIIVSYSNWTGTLYPDSSVVLSGPPFPAPVQNFILCAFTDLDMDTHYSNDTLCTPVQVVVSVPENQDEGLYLSQNIPNPANDETSFRINIPTPGEVSLAINNILGEKIWEKKGRMSSGEHLIKINTHLLQPGIYYYYLSFNNKKLLKKMLVAQ